MYGYGQIKVSEVSNVNSDAVRSCWGYYYEVGMLSALYLLLYASLIWCSTRTRTDKEWTNKTFFVCAFLLLSTSVDLKQEVCHEEEEERSRGGFASNSPDWLQTREYLHLITHWSKAARQISHVSLFARNSVIRSSACCACLSGKQCYGFVFYKTFESFVAVWRYFNMDVAPATAENAGEIVKDELAEKCQKLFQAFLEE